MGPAMPSTSPLPQRPYISTGCRRNLTPDQYSYSVTHCRPHTLTTPLHSTPLSIPFHSTPLPFYSIPFLSIPFSQFATLAPLSWLTKSWEFLTYFKAPSLARTHGTLLDRGEATAILMAKALEHFIHIPSPLFTPIQNSGN